MISDNPYTMKYHNFHYGVPYSLQYTVNHITTKYYATMKNQSHQLEQFFEIANQLAEMVGLISIKVTTTTTLKNHNIIVTAKHNQ